MPMQLGEIATKEDCQRLEQLLRTLTLLVQHQQAPATAATEPLLTINQVAGLTGHTRKTVEAWIYHGKPDLQGTHIYLDTYEFQPGNKRVRLSTLLGWGKAQGITVAPMRAVRGGEAAA